MLKVIIQIIICFGEVIKKRFLKVKLDISFKFHHGLLDGGMAVEFFNKLQEEFYNFKV